MSVIQGTAVTGSGDVGYQISRSLRFNSADSAYLNRTPASAGNRKTFTISKWIKRAALGGGQSFFTAGTASPNPRASFEFTSGNAIYLSFNPTGSAWIEMTTSAVYRDVSAWYHIVVAVDTTQATDTNRVKLYVNGVQVTAFSAAAYPSQNTDLPFNNNVAHGIGIYIADPSQYFNGYLTEINFIDGSALDPTSFGEFNSDTGVWQPIEYTGTYGTNGFYLPFSDNASTTTLGDDFSGNGNDWTTNNFSVTAGAGNDSLVDSPTRYGTDTGAGGEVRGNYATLNPLANGGMTLANGNLDWTCGATQSNIVSTLAVSSGKWYFEYTPTTTNAAGSRKRIGIVLSTYQPATGAYFSGGSSGYAYVQNGNKENNGSASAYGATWDNGDIIGVALDLDAGTLVFYTNNSSQGTAYSGLSGTFVAAVGDFSSSGTMNFGQRPFEYTAPSGFKALVTTNLPTPTIEDGGEYFNTVLWSGNSTDGRTITGVGFQPDFAWIKIRSSAGGHRLQDAVRGANKGLASNATAAEDTDYVLGYVSSFTSDGFVLEEGTDADGFFINNETGETYVGWNWKANGAGVSNTDGTITSAVSVNTTSGFSIVTYTGTGSAATVGHGLGVAPAMVIVKSRDSSTEPWWVYHASIGAGGQLRLNGTNAAGTDGAVLWNSTAPTSSVFSVGTNTGTNGSGDDLVAYCFAPVAGYSAFGSYTGNGSTDGPFVYLGFRPRYLLVKNASAVYFWIVEDTVRTTSNVMGAYLFPNQSDAEGTNSYADFLSNGFKIRDDGASYNGNGNTIIYAAFAENPFSIALAR
jgi:hypothetical protein